MPYHRKWIYPEGEGKKISWNDRKKLRKQNRRWKRRGTTHHHTLLQEGVGECCICHLPFGDNVPLAYLRAKEPPHEKAVAHLTCWDNEGT